MALEGFLPDDEPDDGDEEPAEESFPARPARAPTARTATTEPRPAVAAPAATRSPTACTAREVTLADGTETELDHGHVVIAAITSCTNTSNPSVMIGAGLLAKQRGRARPEVQAVGEDVAGARLEGRHRVLRAAGLIEPLEALGFHLVGYGCTTCIGNSGPLPEEISNAVNAEDLAVVSVLCGQPQLRGAASTPT